MSLCVMLGWPFTGNPAPTPRAAQFVGGPLDGEWINLRGPVVRACEGTAVSWGGYEEGDMPKPPNVTVYLLEKWRGCWAAAPTYRYVRQDPGQTEVT